MGRNQLNQNQYSSTPTLHRFPMPIRIDLKNGSGTVWGGTGVPACATNFISKCTTTCRSLLLLNFCRSDTLHFHGYALLRRQP
jgi:hypothetical protein